MTDGQQRRILIIDDNPDIHNDFRKILTFTQIDAYLDNLESSIFGKKPIEDNPRKNTFVIDSAYQGEEGVDMVKEAYERSDSYAIAFIDIRMPPGLDGWETIQQIWQVDPYVQTVICTAFSGNPPPKLMKDLNDTSRLNILRKPFEVKEVHQMVDTLVHQFEVAKG